MISKGTDKIVEEKLILRKSRVLKKSLNSYLYVPPDGPNVLGDQGILNFYTILLRGKSTCSCHKKITFIKAISLHLNLLVETYFARYLR